MYRIFIREIRRQTHSNWVFPIISPAHATMQDCWIGANKVHHPEDDKTNSSESFDNFDMSGEVIRKLGYQHKQVIGFFLKIE
jgi:hypothetical protein